METQFKAVGISLIVLAIVHAYFPSYFNWKKELRLLSLINKEIMWVHTFFIALTLILTGILCLTCTRDLIVTDLGHKIAIGLAIFWLIRLLFQIFVYSKTLWAGKVFETSIHIIFLLLWSYFTIVFAYIGFQDTL